VDFRIRKADVVLKNYSIVLAQGFLADGPNLERYARDALPEDPAIRFSLKIVGNDIYGKSLCIFINAGGERTVKDVNTLVDRLEGVSVTDIAAKPRRMVPSDVSMGRHKVTYT
jgi:hypothetical protein